MAPGRESETLYAIDRKKFPGMNTMRRLRSLGDIRVAGFYLGPAPMHANQSWMGQRDVLAKEGWGFIPIYVGEQWYRPDANGNPTTSPNPHLTPQKGTADGANATRLMQCTDSIADPKQKTGFATGSVIYLDVEDSGSVRDWQRYQAYVRAWKDEVTAKGFYPGIYGHRDVVNWGRQETMIPWLIEVEQKNRHPAESVDLVSLPKATLEENLIAHQFMIECRFIGLDDLQEPDDHGPPCFDLSVCAVADPSNLAVVDETLRVLKGNKHESPDPPSS